MTLEEAKKILEKEFVEIGFHKSTEPFEFDESRWFVGEKPEVLDAFRVLSKEGYYIAISGHDYDMRKARLGRPTDKPSSDTPSTLNPALKESASQFNDALLDEQAKKIKRLGKEIAKLNGIIHKKNLKIEELEKESFRHLSGKVKMFGENVDLEQMLKDKNAVLADVAEELRLSKIREKNLVEVSQKYMKENEELKNNLADKVVVKIDAQALKSAESALAYKEKVIAEKDEVIADLTHELKAKHKKYVWYKGAYDAAQQILNTIADYAAKHPDKKFSDQMAGVDNAEEGKDHSAKVVLCGKDVVKKFKENEESVFNFFKRHKETAEELYEVADEALDQLLLFGEVIIKSEK